MPSIFISYVREDLHRITVIASALTYAGFDVWLDQHQILPGQDWGLVIRKQINSCDYFLSCWSSQAIGKPGYFHAEYRHAKEVALCRPEGDVFIIPIRLNNCDLPFDLKQMAHILDCYDDQALHYLIQSIQKLVKLSHSKGKRQTPQQVLSYYKNLLRQSSFSSVSSQINQAIKNGDDHKAVLYLLSVAIYLSSVDLTSQKANIRLVQQLERMLELALQTPFTKSTAKVIAALIGFDFYYKRSLQCPYNYRQLLQESLADSQTIDREILSYLNYSDSFAKLLKPFTS